MIKPVAVLTSDVHYNLQTLPLADAAMRLAIKKANDLKVPLVVAGDLHDTKANLRAECMNAMLETFNLLKKTCFILRGNHDAVNEKSKEHALSFLKRECTYNDYTDVDLPAREIISTPWFYNELEGINGYCIHLIPYHHDTDELRGYLKKVDKGSCIIMHQGLTGTNSGEYIQDKSALNPEDVAGFRVISGHYHTRQTIQLPDGGQWDYIGSPYTLNYAEANDSEKGFQILMSDGSLEFVPTNLRKHVKLEVNYTDEINHKLSFYTDADLIWLKVCGPRDVLANFNSSKLIRNCRIEFVYEETNPIKPLTIQLSDTDQLDRIIDSRLDVSEEGRERVKKMWKEF